MTPIQNAPQPLPHPPHRASARLWVLGADTGIVLLALLAADSIYHVPVIIRSLLLATGLVAIGVEAIRAFAHTRDAGAAVGRPARNGVIHRSFIGGLLLLFLVGASVVRPRFLGRELVRVLAPWTDVESAVERPIETPQPQHDDEQTSASPGLKAEPGNTEIQRGDSLRIVVAPGRVTAPMTLRYRIATGPWLTRPMPEDPAQPDRFSEFLKDIGEDLSYQVEMGADASPVYHVHVYDATGLQAIRLSYRYPSAAGLTDRIVTSMDGSIEAVKGTRVEVTLVATASLRTSSLQLYSRQILSMNVRGPEASAVIEVTGDGEYTIAALDVQGTPLELPGRYAIRVVGTFGTKIEAEGRDVEAAMPRE